MFVHVCRTGQPDIRTISVSHWGSELGLAVLAGLSRLYTSLVWESTVLLALCSEETLPTDCQVSRRGRHLQSVLFDRISIFVLKFRGVSESQTNFFLSR